VITQRERDRRATETDSIGHLLHRDRVRRRHEETATRRGAEVQPLEDLQPRFDARRAAGCLCRKGRGCCSGENRGGPPASCVGQEGKACSFDYDPAQRFCRAEPYLIPGAVGGWPDRAVALTAVGPRDPDRFVLETANFAVSRARTTIQVAVLREHSAVCRRSRRRPRRVPRGRGLAPSQDRQQNPPTASQTRRSA
jgi:hypothetical protein